MQGVLPILIDSKKIKLLEKNKEVFEKSYSVKISINKKDSLVYLNATDITIPYKFMKAKQAIEALSLGFSLDDILMLSDDNIFFERIDLTEIYRNRRDLKRIKARIIGSEGKIKLLIEEITGAKIAIGEKEVGIIGDYEQVKTAREAIELIIEGKSHRTLNNFLRMESRKLKRRRLELWEKYENVFHEDKV